MTIELPEKLDQALKMRVREQGDDRSCFRA
jgi:hypothetical protein